MTEPRLSKWIDPQTVVLIVSVLATAYGNWILMQSQLSDQKVEISALNTHINATDDRLTSLKDDFIESRVQLRDLIETLSRQHSQLERSFTPNYSVGAPANLNSVPAK